MTFLERMLRDDEMVRRLNRASDPVAEAILMGATREELADIRRDQYPAEKRWEILSRIRFEAVRSICVLGDSYSETIADSMDPEEKLWGLRSYFWSCAEPLDLPEFATFQTGTFGSAMRNYYEHSGIPSPESNPFFPKKYIQVHDAHHVLLGAAATPRGELQIIAFESGMLLRSPPPLLVLDQLEILLKDAPTFAERLFSAKELCTAWEIGAAADSLLDDWNYAAELSLPLESVRELHGIEPLEQLWDT